MKELVMELKKGGITILTLISFFIYLITRGRVQWLLIWLADQDNQIKQNENGLELNKIVEQYRGEFDDW